MNRIERQTVLWKLREVRWRARHEMWNTYGAALKVLGIPLAVILAAVLRYERDPISEIAATILAALANHR